VITVAFDFYQKLVDEFGELDEEAASRYVEELGRLFVESPEGVALQEQGLEPGGYLEMFLDYALRYVGADPAEMNPSDVREALDLVAQKVMGKPEDLDRVIPELEAFCDFASRAFGLARAATWKREIQDQAGNFHRAVRDPGHWGMAKSMMMEGLARGYDLSTEEGINRWMLTLQTEQLARIELGTAGPGGLGSVAEHLRQSLGMAADAPVLAEGASGEVPLVWGLGGRHPSGPFEPTSASGSGRGKSKSKDKARKKMRETSRRRNRR
jgi:hypothetical protein